MIGSNEVVPFATAGFFLCDFLKLQLYFDKLQTTTVLKAYITHAGLTFESASWKI